jgi:hypothetical protein
MTIKTIKRPSPLPRSGSANSYKLIARTIMATAHASLPIPRFMQPKPTEGTSYIRLDCLSILKGSSDIAGHLDYERLHEAHFGNLFSLGTYRDRALLGMEAIDS